MKVIIPQEKFLNTMEILKAMGFGSGTLEKDPDKSYYTFITPPKKDGDNEQQA